MMAQPYTPHGKRKGAWLDTYLTPRQIVKALGPFDLDPACPATMPWKTARKMYHFPKENGLELPWHGRVWLNPPFSKTLAFCRKFVEHGNGIIILNGRSTETAATQLCMKVSSAVMFPGKRPRYCQPDGEEIGGAWFPAVLVGLTLVDRDVLYALAEHPREEYGGICLDGPNAHETI